MDSVVQAHCGKLHGCHATDATPFYDDSQLYGPDPVLRQVTL